MSETWTVRAAGDWVMHPTDIIGGAEKEDNARCEIDIVARKEYETHLGAVQVYGDGTEECRQRAELIVRAVNCHEELVAACKAVAHFRFSFDHRDQDNGAYRDDVHRLQEAALAAIAKAEGASK